VSEFSWTQEEVGSALGISPEGAGGTYTGVSTDTRTVGLGQLFVALQGASYDAHAFLAHAASSGAAGAVVSRRPEQLPEGMQLWLVADTLAALGKLGHHRRRALRARVVGIAGSNGKTTTKDLLKAALGASLRVHATSGNLNNQIGVPLTLLAAPDDAEVLVVEMGTNEPGEIAILGRIVEPDAAIITAIGEEHLEKLGDLQGVLEEELDALDGLGAEGIALVAEEPPELPARARALLGAKRVRVAGWAADADLRPDGGPESVQVLPDGTTRWSWRGVPVHVPLPGRHNVRNALLALGLAAEWGVEPALAARGIGQVTQPKLRGEWLQIGGMRVLADCYNSNPPSLHASVDLLASLPSQSAKVVVVGTMRELGSSADEIHRRAAHAIASRVGDGIDRVVATGAFADAFAGHAAELGDRLLLEPDPLAAYAALQPDLQGDETLLLKASRGEALERWIPLLDRDWAALSSTPEA
jgi:UDP-N-acetylmuramoyl-tripeptide--D-alanyl-D-alanine ligase